MPLALRILLLALAFAVAGRLALMLAIAPGFASAVFPPVGIALAAVLIWGYPMLVGVFLGSTLLNLSIGFNSLDQLSLQDLLVAAGIALGTTLQGLAASWLIRNFVGFPTPLTGQRSILLLLLLGGPMACLISASIGTGVLYLSQIIGAEELPFSWWTWWVGDSIGVLLFTPLMFILFAEPRPLWRSRASSVGLPLLISCAIMVLLFIRASEAEQNNLRLRFHEQAKMMSTTLKFRFELYSKAAQSIERLFASSDAVSRKDFARFVANLPSTYPGITALSWDALITGEQRTEFEARMAAEGLADFHIREHDGAGQLVPAGPRPFYVPVTYVEPFALNSKALGFDVASMPLRRRALESARDSAHTVMTAPITLIQDNETPQPGVLLLYPVYKGDLPPSSIAERRRQLRGYAAAVVRMADLIENAMKAYPADSYQLHLEDITDAEPQPLYGQADAALPAYAADLLWEEQLEIGERRLRLAISPTEAFLQRNHGLQPWAVLAGGLLLCSLLGGYLLTTTGRADQIRHEVRQRTLELSEILENAAEGILIFDEQGLIERANPASSRLFGYATSELVGRPIGSLIPSLRPCSAAALDGQLRKALEVSGSHAHANQLELEISLSSYELPGRRLYICMLRDISARKQVERLKSEFIATVSHELRTPLTSIKGSLGLLTAGAVGPLGAQAHELVRIAQSNSERLVSLVNDILDIEKLEFGHSRIQLTRTDLRPLLHEALAHNQGYADGHQVRLSLDDSALPAQVPVRVDGQRLQQVLSNLIANAVKFSEPQGQVEISAEVVDAQVRVQVLDHGPGIADEFRERIFQKFAQADSSDSRRRGGTGLGLSICKTLIERMHGQIGYRSQLGQGSTFYFSLPLADA
ncbi:CHASE domain-containing protein [Pseudomonas sp. MBLB4136]|uniref:CHASE domain-containing protein n=1 Tax=Pseudomonas sp. MBLB4136 TaxID=3451558 RepID=UPI003F74E4E6